MSRLKQYKKGDIVVRIRTALYEPEKRPEGYKFTVMETYQQNNDIQLVTDSRGVTHSNRGIRLVDSKET